MVNKLKITLFTPRLGLGSWTFKEKVEMVFLKRASYLMRPFFYKKWKNKIDFMIMRKGGWGEAGFGMDFLWKVGMPNYSLSRNKIVGTISRYLLCFYKKMILVVKLLPWFLLNHLNMNLTLILILITCSQHDHMLKVAQLRSDWSKFSLE